MAIIITKEGLKSQGAPLSVGSTWQFDAALEAQMVASGNAAYAKEKVEQSSVKSSLATLPTGETLRSQPTALLFYNDPSNFTIPVNGTGYAKNAYADSMLSPGAIQLQVRTDITAGTTNLDKTGLNIYLSANECIELHYYVADKTKMGGLIVYFSNDNGGFTNYARADLQNTALYKAHDNGWNIARFKVSDMQTFNGFSLSNPIQTIRTQCTAANGISGVAVVLDSLWRLAPGKPRFVPFFDDAWATAYDYGDGYGFYTYLKSKGLKGSIGVIGSLVGTSGYMTHAQLREVYDAGFDLVPHGIGYGSGAGDLLSLADTAARIANIKQNQRFLLAMGFTRAADIFVFPQGKYDEALLSAMRDAGFKMARATCEAIAVDELASREYRMKLPGFDMGNRTSAQIIAYLDAAKAVGGTAITYGHKIGAVADSMTITQNNFTAVIDYVVDNGFETLTASQYRDNLNGSRVASF